MSMAPIYLTEEDREIVAKFAKNGTHNSHLIVRANILLMLDRTGKKDHMRIKKAADSHGVSRQTVYNIIEDYHNSKDINDFLSRKVRETPPNPPKIDGELEAHIIVLKTESPSLCNHCHLKCANQSARHHQAISKTRLLPYC